MGRGFERSVCSCLPLSDSTSPSPPFSIASASFDRPLASQLLSPGEECSRMTLRSLRDTVESLRVILRKVEQTADPGQDAAAVIDLKRILRKRIAELEAAEDRIRPAPQTRA